MSEESQKLLAGIKSEEPNENAPDEVVTKAFNDEIKILDQQQSDLYYRKSQMLVISNQFEESLDNAFKVIAYDDDLVYGVPKITFKQILDLLNWHCDDVLNR